MRKKPRKQVTKKKSRRAKPVKRARTAKGRKAVRPRKRAKPPAAARARSALRRAPRRAAAAGPPAGGGMAADVAAALTARGYDPLDPGVVDAITAVGAGYRKGPASDPPFGFPGNVDVLVAREFVDRYVDGDHAVLDRAVHRPTVRATVDFNLTQLSRNDLGETGRATLTSICLGAWDPAADENAKRNAIASFVVRWYCEGTTA